MYIYILYIYISAQAATVARIARHGSSTRSMREVGAKAFLQTFLQNYFSTVVAAASLRHLSAPPPILSRPISMLDLGSGCGPLLSSVPGLADGRCEIHEVA